MCVYSNIILSNAPVIKMPAVIISYTSFFHLEQLYFAVNETQHFLFMFNNTAEGSLLPEGAF